MCAFDLTYLAVLKDSEIGFDAIVPIRQRAGRGILPRRLLPHLADRLPTFSFLAHLHQLLVGVADVGPGRWDGDLVGDELGDGRGALAWGGADGDGAVEGLAGRFADARGGFGIGCNGSGAGG